MPRQEIAEAINWRRRRDSTPRRAPARAREPIASRPERIKFGTESTPLIRSSLHRASNLFPSK